MIRHFLRDTDLTVDEQARVLDLALHMKKDRFAFRPLSGPQTVAVFFDKTSTRTRVSFAAGIAELGGAPLVIGAGESQLGHKESIADTARVLSRMVSAIVWRTYKQADLEEMSAHSAVPVINALSDDFHPCQVLADLLTVREHRGELAGKILAYVGDAANNMAHSYLLGGATAGMHVKIAGPPESLPRESIVAEARQRAQETGAEITITTDPSRAVSGADAVATDTWVSMGQEEEKAERQKAFADYRVTSELMKRADSEAVFLHCLPAYRGYEVTADIIDGPQSVVWDEAENRLHAQKSLMTFLLTAGLA